MASMRTFCASLTLAVILTLAPTGYGRGRSGDIEIDALLAQKALLADPNGVLASWDGSLVDPCTWFHITCNEQNKVTQINLGRSNLAGPLAPDLRALQSLQYLEMFGNKISGSIPAELGELKNLRSLDLYENDISGTIPPSLGNLKSLVFLRIDHNQLTGNIPAQLATIPTLGVVDISNNHLCGIVPPSLAQKPGISLTLSNNPRLGRPC